MRTYGIWICGCILLVSACKSPLDIDTPRERDTDDTTGRQDTASAVSIALVFDASGSMSGRGVAVAKYGAAVFVDSLNGTTDEAYVMWAATTPRIVQTMTHRRDSLRRWVDSLYALGVSAVHDALYAAILELDTRAKNDSVALIYFTNGDDNSSSHSPQDVISLAQARRVPLYIIGFGDQYTEPLYWNMALMTGGGYFHVSTEFWCRDAYLSILRRLR